MHVELTVENREIKMDFGYDETFLADVSTRIMMQQRAGCEPEMVCLMARILQEGDVVVDGGANIGFFTIMMAKLVGPTGRVLAFEPGENNLAKLRENIAMNNLDNVEVFDVALWHRNNHALEFFLSEDSGANSIWRSEMSVSKTVVTAVKLSDYWRDRQRRIKLIKLDIEGSEQHALEGAYIHLGMKVPYIVCELNSLALQRLGHTQGTLRKFMLQFGYDMFLLHDNGALPTFVPVTSVVEPSAINTNVLFSTAPKVAEAWPIVRV